MTIDTQNADRVRVTPTRSLVEAFEKSEIELLEILRDAPLVRRKIFSMYGKEYYFPVEILNTSLKFCKLDTRRRVELTMLIKCIRREGRLLLQQKDV